MFLTRTIKPSIPSSFLLCISVLLPWTNILGAQSSPHLEQVSIEQGLSYTRVHSFLQDSRGFLWIGTEIGLNRYDGYHFTVYKHDFRDSSVLLILARIDFHCRTDGKSCAVFVASSPIFLPCCCLSQLPSALSRTGLTLAKA